jgi:hypothetical protein
VGRPDRGYRLSATVMLVGLRMGRRQPCESGAGDVLVVLAATQARCRQAVPDQICHCTAWGWGRDPAAHGVHGRVGQDEHGDEKVVGCVHGGR